MPDILYLGICGQRCGRCPNGSLLAAGLDRAVEVSSMYGGTSKLRGMRRAILSKASRNARKHGFWWCVMCGRNGS